MKKKKQKKMKQHSYNILALLSLLCFSIVGMSQTTFTKEDKKEFEAEVKEYSVLEIDNQYGDVEFVTWEKELVKIEVNIKIESRRQENVDKGLNNLSIFFNKSNSQISCRTDWGGDALGMGYRDVVGTAGYKHLIVNYKVYLPSSLELEVTNRFGSIYMENHDGRITASVSHGDFRARNLKDVRSIQVKYGKLKLNEVNNATIELSSVKYAEVLHAKELTLNSSSSDIEIEEVEKLILNSKHDEISVRKIKELKGKMYLSDLKIQNLTGDVNAECKLGSVRIKNCSNTTGDIDIIGSRTDVNITFSNDIAIRVIVVVDEEKYLSYSDKFKVQSHSRGAKNKIRSNLEMGSGDEHLTTRIETSKGYVDLNVN